MQNRKGLAGALGHFFFVQKGMRIGITRIGLPSITVLCFTYGVTAVVPLPMSDFDWRTTLEIFLLIAGAFVLALPIGWDQEKERQPAGLRVFPIVAAGACAFILVAGKLPGGDAQTQARVLVGVISAVGFIGGGAILKDSAGNAARGTAAAASIWVTGAIGVAVASKQYVIALILSITVFLSHKLLRPAGDAAHDDENADSGREQSEPREKQQPAGQQETNGEQEKKGGKSDKANRNDNAGVADIDVPSQRPESGEWSPQPFDQLGTASVHPRVVPEMPMADPPEGSAASIMGVLVAYKDVIVQGVTHRVGLIRDEKNAEYLVDLGPAERLNNLALARGMYVMVHGWVTWVGNRQGLRASQVLFNGGVIDIAA